MENVIPNAGALPSGARDTRGTDPDELGLIDAIETGVPSDAPRTAFPEMTVDPDGADKPREHVRSPELRRNSTKLTMTAAAVIGAAAGARLLFGEAASEPLMNSVSQMFAGTFGEVFLRQTLLGALFLAAEFILGFFAFGDLAVWAAPFLYGSGTVLRAVGSIRLLPGTLFCLVGVILGAAYSADMSGLLLKLTRGGTVYMDTHPRRAYTLGFLGCLAAVVLGAILMGVLVTT